MKFSYTLRMIPRTDVMTVLCSKVSLFYCRAGFGVTLNREGLERKESDDLFKPVAAPTVCRVMEKVF